MGSRVNQGEVSGLRAYLDNADLLEMANKVAHEHSATLDDVLSMVRSKYATRPRQHFWHWLHTVRGSSLQTIAHLWRCDWTTVRHGVVSHGTREASAGTESASTFEKGGGI